MICFGQSKIDLGFFPNLLGGGRVVFFSPRMTLELFPFEKPEGRVEGYRELFPFEKPEGRVEGYRNYFHLRNLRDGLRDILPLLTVMGTTEAQDMQSILECLLVYK